MSMHDGDRILISSSSGGIENRKRSIGMHDVLSLYPQSNPPHPNTPVLLSL